MVKVQDHKFRKLVLVVPSVFIVVGIFFFLKVVVQYLEYVFYSLPRLFSPRTNRLDLGLLVLSYWLILYGYYWKKGKQKALYLASVLFAVFWILFGVVCFICQRNGFSLGALWFEFPGRRERFLFYLDSALSFLGILWWQFPHCGERLLSYLGSAFSFLIVKRETGQMRSDGFRIGLLHYLVAFGFSVWSGIFIFRTSFVAIDGKRYFCLFDDAMISMRYAWNLSHGLGLVWNKGIRIEGFTNPLMTLYMSLITTFAGKSLSVLLIQVSGIGFMLVTALFAMAVTGELTADKDRQERDFLMLISFVASLCYYPLVYWSLMGMETGLLSALLLPIIWLAIRFRDRTHTLFGLPILMGLAYLTRPDALIPILIIFGYRAFGLLKRRQGSAALITEGTIISCFIIIQAVFRWKYYGGFVPNTYILKVVGIPWEARIRNGTAFIIPFLKSVSPLLLLAAMNVFVYRDRHRLLLAGLFLASVIYQVWVGGDPWLYWRMLCPFMPLVLALAIIHLWNILILNRKKEVNYRFAGKFRYVLERATHVGVLLFMLAFANKAFLSEILFFQAPYQQKQNEQQVNTAIALSQITTPDATVAVARAGCIPYYTGLTTIDILGKSDAYIASLPAHIPKDLSWKKRSYVPGHNKYDLQYSIVALRPTYTARRRWREQDVSKFVEDNYQQIEYEGVNLSLLKGSQDVLWDKIIMNSDVK